jgi:hypothetical protein
MQPHLPAETRRATVETDNPPGTAAAVEPQLCVTPNCISSVFSVNRRRPDAGVGDSKAIMDRGNYISSAPTFLGANPAEVKEGPQQGLRVLAAEEDLARKLMASFNADQKKTATITKYWQGNDILSAEKIAFDIGNPVGLQGSKMNAAQKENLLALIEEYAGRVAPEAAMRAMNEVRANNGLNTVFFAWIGTETRGQAHYYRVHAPSFVIEYENSQNNANHIHSTFRDLKNDFGQDALRAHLIQDHGFAVGN